MLGTFLLSDVLPGVFDLDCAVEDRDVGQTLSSDVPQFPSSAAYLNHSHQVNDINMSFPLHVEVRPSDYRATQHRLAKKLRGAVYVLPPACIFGLCSITYLP